MTIKERISMGKIYKGNYSKLDIPTYIRNRDKGSMGELLDDLMPRKMDSEEDVRFAEEAERDKWNLYESTRGVGRID